MRKVSELLDLGKEGANLQVIIKDQLKVFSQLFEGVIVAHSGGVDSTALFHLICHFSKSKKNFSVGLFHANFGLRGSESNDDETFSRALAQQRDLAFHFLDGRLLARKQISGESVQEWARRIRYAALADLAEQGFVIALGHHQDDVAENTLLRIARGASIGQLAGMTHWRPPYWRPLLETSKDCLINWTEQFAWQYRHDSSNDLKRYSRNVVRHEVLPVLENLYPNAAKRIARTASDGQELVQWIKEKLEKEWPNRTTELTPWLRTLPISIRIEAIKLLTGGQPKPWTRSLLREIATAIDRPEASNQQTWQLPGGGRLEYIGGDLTFFNSTSTKRGLVRQRQHQASLGESDFCVILTPGTYGILNGVKASWRVVPDTPQSSTKALCLPGGRSISPNIKSLAIQVELVTQPRDCLIGPRAGPWRTVRSWCRKTACVQAGEAPINVVMVNGEQVGLWNGRRVFWFEDQGDLEISAVAE